MSPTIVYNKLNLCTYLSSELTGDTPPSPPQASQGAYAASSEGPVARAVHKCRDAVKASPSNHTAQYHLGRLLLLTGQPSQALPHLRAALGIKPTHTESRCVSAKGDVSIVEI